jgi:hypothetical protein
MIGDQADPKWKSEAQTRVSIVISTRIGATERTHLDMIHSRSTSSMSRASSVAHRVSIKTSVKNPLLTEKSALLTKHISSLGGTEQQRDPSSEQVQDL